MTRERIIAINVVCIVIIGILCLIGIAQLPNIYSAPIRNGFPENMDTTAKTVVSRDVPADIDLPEPDDDTLILYDAHSPNLDSSKYSSVLSTERDSSYRTLSYAIRLTPDNILADRSEMNHWNSAFANYEVFTKDLTLPLTHYAYSNAISGIEEAICSYVGSTNNQVMLDVKLTYLESTDLAPTYVAIRAQSPGSEKLELSCFVHNYSPEGIIDYKTKQWVKRPDAMTAGR